MLSSRCACLPRGRLPLAAPVLKGLRGPEARCNTAATAAERPISDSAIPPAGSDGAGQVEGSLDAGHSNGDVQNVKRLRNSVVYNVVSQALADGPNADGIRPPAAQGNPAELGSLRQDLSGLRELLSTQAELVREQSHAIRQLKGMVSVQTQRVVNSARSRPEVRPLDAQLAAIGDRRYLGMYDARFHSTNK